MKRLVVILILLLSRPAIPQDAAPDHEFKRLAELMSKSTPNQELVDTLYAFMEKWPRDARGDQVQFWVGQTQAKRKFHNEAIKEFGFVIKDFPDSPLVLPALRAQAGSYLAIDKHGEAGDCFQAIVDRKPSDFNADRNATGIFREAIIWLAERKIRGKEPAVDEAVGLLAQLPDQRESISRIVELYVHVERFDDAMKAIERLPESDRLLGYRLLIRLYSARPGAANLFDLQNKVFEREMSNDATDRLVRELVDAIGRKGAGERHKALQRVVDKYDRLKRWAAFGLCELDRNTDLDRLTTFIGDYQSGGDVEQCKLWSGEYHERAGDPAKARDTYATLKDSVAGHFRIAETYYGQRAKQPDLDGGEKELSAIVKRFYSAGVCCDALMRRADLQAARMKKPDAAVATLRELIDRFPSEGDWPIRAYIRMGGVLRGQKKQDEAIVAYEQVILKHPQSGFARQAWLEVAACYEEKEDRARAIDTYRTVLRKYPRTGEASRAHTILETKYKIADTDVSDR